MNLTAHQELWNNIQRFALDEPNATITFSKKLANQQKWSPAFTDRVIEEYRKFIFLCCISPKGASPSKAVDEAWHLHLTYTQSYWNAFCKKTLGKDIHHYPSTGGTQEDHKHADWYGETLRLYESVFGAQPPADIWPKPVDVSPPAEQWQPVEVLRPAQQQQGLIPEQPYSIGKNMVAIVVLLLLLPFGINYLLTGIMSPYSVAGPQFLLFYALVGIAALIAYYLLRKDKLAFMERIVDAWSPVDISVYQLTHAVYGKHRAVETCLIDLYRRNLVTVNDKGRIVVHKQNYQAPVKEENPLVPRLLVKADNSTVKYNAIANDWYKQTAFEHPAIQKLFVLTDQKEPFLQKYWVVLIAFFIGVFRIVQGVSNDRPVLFLVLEVVSLVVVTLLINQKFSTKALVINRLEKLMQENAGSKALHNDEVVNDYAINGQSVLDGLPASLMLGSMFVLFPATTNARKPVSDQGNGSEGNSPSAESSCSGGSSCGSDSSCGGGSGCGGCGGGGD